MECWSNNMRYKKYEVKKDLPFGKFSAVLQLPKTKQILSSEGHTKKYLLYVK